MDSRPTYTVLDPTHESHAVNGTGRMAPRLPTLEGKVLAVINNWKMNSDTFLQHLLNLIKKHYTLKDVIWINKTNASLPITDSMLEKLKAANAVIAGVGD